MTKKNLFPFFISLLSILFSAAALPAQEDRTVRVPEGNGKPILIDGLFTPGEWDDALKMEIRPDIHLLVKKSAGFVFIGIRYHPFNGSIVDLFLSPDAKAIRHFHVSAQLGERLLNEVPGAGDDPEFTWGDTSGWYANEIRWNAAKVQALVKEGKNQYEAQNESLYRYDGFEIQIRESKLGGESWLLRLESPGPPDWSKPVVFPEGTDAASTRGWIKLLLR
jgi:hypothetical protein